MTITIKEPRTVKTPKETTDACKRRLRRIRISAAKTGAIIPYEPVSTPVVNDDAPKLTNTAKRMARKRKKYAAHMAELGLTVEEGAASFFKSEKRKKRKKTKKSAAAIIGIEKAKPTVVQITTDISATGSKHVRFDDAAEGQPEKSPTTPTKSKKRKHKKNKKEVVPNDTCLEKTVSDNKPFPEKNVMVDDMSPLGNERKRKKIKKNVAPEDTCQEKSGDEMSPAAEVNEKDNNGENTTVEQKPSSVQAAKPKGKKEKKQRFILFIGNLSYDVTEAEIKAHFEKVGGITSVRISKHMEESMKGKSKGFAHLEVEDEESYLKAMSMHHTYMQKRRINVEYSSGQTKDVRIEQKQRKRAGKAGQEAYDIERLNPCGGKSKPHSRFNRTRQPTSSHSRFRV